MKIGLLHPGAMGVSVGNALVASGHEVCWVPAGRSAETEQRAAASGFTALADLPALAVACSGVISVCPPHGARQLADAVHAAGFRGIYLDANAVAPETARAISDKVGSAFVDGGIVGPPAQQPGSTRLYLAGERAVDVADWFAAGYLDARVVEGAAGAASALKMCYAAYTKGSSALLLAVRALAAAEGVEAGLLEEWSISQPALVARSEGAALGTAGKAWRFVGEMEEIAATFAAQDLPDGFHLAAADIYARMSDLRSAGAVTLEAVIDALTHPPAR